MPMTARAKMTRGRMKPPFRLIAMLAPDLRPGTGYRCGDGVARAERLVVVDGRAGGLQVDRGADQRAVNRASDVLDRMGRRVDGEVRVGAGGDLPGRDGGATTPDRQPGRIQGKVVDCRPRRDGQRSGDVDVEVRVGAGGDLPGRDGG